MFEQLFGSKTRVKLMRLFLDNPEKKFFVREITRLTDSLINSVRRELDNLMELKLICAQERKEPDAVKKSLNVKRFYFLNSKNLFQQDLINLFAKGKILLEKKLIERIKRLGDVHYISFGGTFVEDGSAQTDILIIGELDKEKAVENMQRFESEVGRAVRYTIMDLSEYQLRTDISDRFLKDIMEGDKNIVVMDKLTKKKRNSEHTEFIE